MKKKKIDPLDGLHGTLVITLTNKTNKKQKVNVFSLCEDINKNVEVNVGVLATYDWLMKICLVHPLILSDFKIRAENTDFFLEEIILRSRRIGRIMELSLCLMRFLDPKINQPKVISIDKFNYIFDGLHEIELTLPAKEEVKLIFSYLRNPKPKDVIKKSITGEYNHVLPIYIENETSKIQIIRLFDFVNKEKSINKGVKIKSLFSNFQIDEALRELEHKMINKWPTQFKTLVIYSKNNPAQINQEIIVRHVANKKELKIYEFKNNRTQDANLDFIDKFRFTYVPDVNKYLEIKILPKTKVLYLFEIKETKTNH